MKQRTVVQGLDESDDPSSEQGGQPLRKRQRLSEDGGPAQPSSKRAHQQGSNAAAADGAGGMQDQQQKQEQQQQEQQHKNGSAGGHDHPGTPFACEAAAATAAAFPDAQQEEAPGAAVAVDAERSASGTGLGLRHSSRQPKPSRHPDALSSQPSTASGGVRLGMKLNKKQGKTAAKRFWNGPDKNNWTKGQGERPGVGAGEPVPTGPAAVGWSLWMAYVDDDETTWFRGVITYFDASDPDDPSYQVVMEDGETRIDKESGIVSEVAKGDLLFCYPPKEPVMPELVKQHSVAATDGATAAAAAGTAAAEVPAGTPTGKSKAKGKGKAQQQQAQQEQQQADAAAVGDAAGTGSEAEKAAAAGQAPATAATQQQQQQPKKQQSNRQQPGSAQKQQQQRKKQQQKPAALSVRAATPTSPQEPLSARSGPQQLDLSKLSDRAAQLAKSLQQVQQGTDLVLRGLKMQQQALADVLAANTDFATAKEVKEGCGDLIHQVTRVRTRATEANKQLAEVSELADKVKDAMRTPGQMAQSSSGKQQQQQQKRGATPGTPSAPGKGPAGAAAGAAAAASRPGMPQQQQQRLGDPAAVAAARQQLAKAQSDKAAAEKAAAAAKEAAAAEAAACEEARAAAAAAEERATELEAFVARLKLLVPLEPVDDNPIRSKAVALLASVLHPPVAVSPFRAAAELEQMLSKAYGLVGAGKDMYLKHLYMIWCVLGGRELAAAAEAAEEAAKAADAAAAAAAAVAEEEMEGAEVAAAATAAAATAQLKQQAADAAIAKAQEVLKGATGVADAAAVRNALLDGSATVQEVFELTCSKLGFDKQRDK